MNSTAELGERRRELVALGRLEGERLLDRERLVHELGLRSHERDRGPVAGEIGEREHCFEAGDAAAGDQDPRLGIGALHRL